ncbi:MAG: signal peptide peptidase SppA [Bacteroidetes bacterium]|nr:signal peptide peptidase SppA [Bacteroidota bacterium]
MKQFFGAFFGSIIGIIISTLLALFLIIAVVKASISKVSEKEEPITIIKNNSILKFVIDGAIVDRNLEEDPLNELKKITPLGGIEDSNKGLNLLVQKIKTAKNDDNIKGIYLYFKSLQAGFATTEELRNALIDFKSSGKFIYSYSEAMGQKEYYLASASTKIFINPQGGIEWKGLSTSIMFYKKMFDKVGLDVQIFRHGKFKSAVEPFMVDKMSEANRYQTETFLNSIWQSILKGVSEQRKVSESDLQNWANNLSIRFPDDAVGKLIDATAYEDEVLSELAKKTNTSEKPNFVSLSSYTNTKTQISKNKIAVVYAIGSIESGQGDDQTIGSDRIAKAIKDARLNDDIKAIVLRVNSPGGSALASDVMWREVTLAKKQKPVIVSMGDLAASGGYYISCAADYIFAQPNTITGSIGVFGMMPNFQKIVEEKLFIHIDSVNTNKYSDLGSLFRPVSKPEYDFIQGSIEKVYDVFTSRVAEGRKMKQSDVDSVGQGRVWSGLDALKINLVDEIGGLDKAIAFAAKKAKLDDYKIIDFPKLTNPFDKWLGKKEKDIENKIMKLHFGEAYPIMMQLKEIIKTKGVQARLPFEFSVN